MTSHAYRTIVAAIVLLPSLAAAQDTARVRARRDSIGRDLVYTVTSARIDPAQDPAKAFEEYLFAPELIMQHQARLRITPAQRNVIVGEISKLQAAALQVQWNVAEEAQKLTELLQSDAVVEADALAQAERLIGYETAVKRAQLSMLIRIRNTLTTEQRSMLQDLRGTRWGTFRRPPG